MKEILELLIELVLLGCLCISVAGKADVRIVIQCGVLYLASVIRHKK